MILKVSTVKIKPKRRAYAPTANPRILRKLKKKKIFILYTTIHVPYNNHETSDTNGCLFKSRMVKRHLVRFDDPRIGCSLNCLVCFFEERTITLKQTFNVHVYAYTTTTTTTTVQSQIHGSMSPLSFPLSNFFVLPFHLSTNFVSLCTHTHTHTYTHTERERENESRPKELMSIHRYRTCAKIR